MPTLEQRLSHLERILVAGSRPVSIAVGGLILRNRLQSNKGADIASATTLALGTDGNYFDVTGTTTIDYIDNKGWRSGSIVALQFDGSVTVTHNKGSATGSQANLLLSGAADLSATANDTLTLVYDGTNFRELARTVI
jgi:hypothetical protein